MYFICQTYRGFSVSAFLVRAKTKKSAKEIVSKLFGKREWEINRIPKSDYNARVIDLQKLACKGVYPI